MIILLCGEATSTDYFVRSFVITSVLYNSQLTLSAAAAQELHLVYVTHSIQSINYINHKIAAAGIRPLCSNVTD